MAEQTVEDLVQRIAQMEEHMNTAGQAIRDAGLRAQPAENRTVSELRRQQQKTAARAARLRQGTVPTVLGRTFKWITC